MFLRFLCITFATFCMGCAGGTKWVHANYSDAQFRIDERHCSNLSNQLSAPQTNYQPSPFDPRLTPLELAAQSSYNSGAQLGSAIGTAFQSTSIYRDCLYSLGYKRQ